jgi:hypothetical protein
MKLQKDNLRRSNHIAGKNEGVMKRFTHVELYSENITHSML